MQQMSDALCEALGRIVTDSGFKAHFFADPERALSAADLSLSPEEVTLLAGYVRELESGSEVARETLSTLLRSTDRLVQA
jgi:hypothetical protein